MSSVLPSFSGPHGEDPSAHIIRIAERAVPTEGDCLAAGAILRSRIRERSFSGVDANGNQFTPYSERYAKEKARHGRSTVVNLFGYKQNAHMLDSIILISGGARLEGAQEPATVSDGGPPGNAIRLEIFGDQAIRAKVHNEGGSVRTRLGSGKKKKKNGMSSFSMPRRHFYDANAEDINLMGFAIRERIESRLKNL